MAKTKQTEITKVKFLIDEEGDTFAYFPEELFSTNKDREFYTCYAHVGQHSACDPDYAKECQEATPEQYADLKAELENLVGYKLQVVTAVKELDTITIIGRRWFDAKNGNTYFSSVALINNKPVIHIPFSYGYGNQYEHETFNKLVKAGYCPDAERNEAFSYYCDRKKISYYITHSDVNRKKDL